MKNEVVGYLKEGKIYDLHCDVNGQPIERNSILGLDIIRHSCAHIMAQAIKNIYKTVNFAVGPTTESGFYYDFRVFKDNEPINLSSNDLIKIQKEMYKIVDQQLNFRKNITTKDEFLSKYYDPFKEIVFQGINSNEISTYTQGDFIDLCKGPHVKNTSIIGKHFELTSISEVSWKDLRLQRIEGICFESEESLKSYKTNKALQESKDHRKLGKKMDLFSFHPLAPGFAIWHPKGLFIIEKIKDLVRNICYKGFKEYETPLVLKQELFQKTGHLDNYKENMFLFKDLCLKPMNCPCHALIFQEFNASFRDLPIRIAEFGSCFRDEELGGLNGLKRARKLTQDDGHIFCTISQITNEISRFLTDAKNIYQIFNFHDMKIKLATRPSKSIGTAEMWHLAENYLKESLKDYQYILAEGDGAFYGPKIELHLKDNLGRFWQCGTIQVDFFLAERLSASYIDEDNQKKFPIILHRAILGSIERFVGVLLENGPLPFWLKPLQMAILPISEKYINYAQDIFDQIKNQIRCYVDEKDETIGKKIKKTLEEKIDLMIIVGEQEQANNSVTLRINNENHSMSIKELEDFIKQMQSNFNALKI